MSFSQKFWAGTTEQEKLLLVVTDQKATKTARYDMWDAKASGSATKILFDDDDRTHLFFKPVLPTLTVC